MPSILKVDTIQESTTSNGVVFSHPVELPNGTAAAPGLAFSSDTNSGLYRIAEDKIGVAVNGARVGEVGAGYGGFTGNVIQVQNTILTSTVTVSVTGPVFADITGLSVNITPKYSSSKILILTQATSTTNSAYIYCAFRIMRDSTPVIVGDAAGSRMRATGGLFLQLTNADQIATHFFSGVDTPNTTNTITYKLQVSQSAGSGSNPIYINRSSADADSVYAIRTISSITAMEIQQ